MIEPPFVFGEARLHVVADGGGPTMLFQHGLCGDALQTADVFPREAGYRCVTIEMPGHGASTLGAPEKLSLANFTEACARWIETRETAPIIVGGISMGAAIALRLAARRPELVRGLVLARPAWLFDAAPPNLAIYAHVGDLLAHHSPDEARTTFLKSALAARLARMAPDNLATLEALFTRIPIESTRELLQRIPRDGPEIDRAAVTRIKAPTLTLGCQRDEAHPIAYARALAEAIPGARFVEITPKSDDKDRYRVDFARALAQFLKEFP